MTASEASSADARRLRSAGRRTCPPRSGGAPKRPASLLRTSRARRGRRTVNPLVTAGSVDTAAPLSLVSSHQGFSRTGCRSASRCAPMWPEADTTDQWGEQRATVVGAGRPRLFWMMRMDGAASSSGR